MAHLKSKALLNNARKNRITITITVLNLKVEIFSINRNFKITKCISLTHILIKINHLKRMVPLLLEIILFIIVKANLIWLFEFFA